MTGEIEKGVNYERVEVTPTAGDDEEVLEPEETDPHSPEGNDGDPDADPDADPADESPDGKPEALRQNALPTEKTPAAVAAAPADPENPNGLKRLPEETPREFALRSELTKTRGLLRKQRTDEVMETIRPITPAAKVPELDERTKEVLAKYPKEQLDALREVMPALAAEMGFVRKDELAGSSYADQAQTALDGFLEKHPEYTPEKDHDGTLWTAFKAEFAQYRQPENPKDYRRLFEKVHASVFGIQPGGDLPKVQAAQQKVRVASHAGASGPTANRQTNTRSGAGSGLRLDMLKGFDDDEKDRIASRAQGD